MKDIIVSSAVVFLLTLSNINLTRADWNEPISANDYQSIIGQGFSTHYFTRNYFKNGQNISERFKSRNIKMIYDAGFRNLRLRCEADAEGLLPYDTSEKFALFLEDLTTVVNVCLKNDVKPIISWVNERDENNATEEGKTRYIDWWGAVAKRLKNKDYRLSFNLFTELGRADGLSLRENHDLYNEWTQAVVDKIRLAKGNNKKRILILSSPVKTSKRLDIINETIYKNDEYMMVEWHVYAGGPNQIFLKEDKKSGQYWEGNGTDEDRGRVDKAIKFATDFTNSTGVPTYQGAWMPYDNIFGALNQEEVINFARYFIRALGEANIPWSSNVLDKYMNTSTSTWITESQVIAGTELNMDVVLEAIKEAMQPYIPDN